MSRSSWPLHDRLSSLSGLCWEFPARHFDALMDLPQREGAVSAATPQCPRLAQHRVTRNGFGSLGCGFTPASLGQVTLKSFPVGFAACNALSTQFTPTTHSNQTWPAGQAEKQRERKGVKTHLWSFQRPRSHLEHYLPSMFLCTHHREMRLIILAGWEREEYGERKE